LTNSAIAGPFADTIKSNDYYSQGHLDEIASGGVWIVESKGGTMVNRHQLSTAASSVETRELSITTQIDYTAKFLRELVEPTIGINVISDSFINQIRTAFNGAAETLVKQGILRELNILSVTQDTNNPDTITADFSLLPLYPVNYINITLTF